MKPISHLSQQRNQPINLQPIMRGGQGVRFSFLPVFLYPIRHFDNIHQFNNGINSYNTYTIATRVSSISKMHMVEAYKSKLRRGVGGICQSKELLNCFSPIFIKFSPLHKEFSTLLMFICTFVVEKTSNIFFCHAPLGDFQNSWIRPWRYNNRSQGPCLGELDCDKNMPLTLIILLSHKPNC